jgi:hypothetical protein
MLGRAVVSHFSQKRREVGHPKFGGSLTPPLASLRVGGTAEGGCPHMFIFDYGSSRTQMLRKLSGSLLSPWAWSLMGAPSNFL